MNRVSQAQSKGVLVEGEPLGQANQDLEAVGERVMLGGSEGWGGSVIVRVLPASMHRAAEAPSQPLRPISGRGRGGGAGRGRRLCWRLHH